MKKILGNSRLISIAILNIILMIVTLAFFKPAYETNDDFMMGLISSGAYGDSYQQCLVFSNILYGYIVEFFSNVFGIVNWYVVFQYIIIILSIISIMYIISKYVSLTVTFTINIAFWYMFFFQMFQKVQFTKSAGIAIVAGCVMIWYSFMKSKIGVRIAGILMCLVGTCIRSDCLPLCAVYLGLLAFCYTVTQKLSRKQLVQGVITVVSLACVIGIFWGVDKAYYSNTKEWEQYAEYNEVRANLLDYGMPSYEANEEKYNQIGYSKNDTSVLKRWILADYEKFDYETLKEISQWKTTAKVDRQVVKSWFIDFVTRNYTNIFLWVWIILTLVTLCLNKTCKLYGILNIFLVATLYIILYYIGRIVPRVEFALWLSAIFGIIICILSFYRIDTKWSKKTSIKYIVVMFTFLCLFVGVKYYQQLITEGNTYRSEPAGLLEKITEDEENVYLMDTVSFSDACLCYSPYKAIPNYYLSNFYLMGGWDIQTPFNKEKMKELELENPMEDQLYKENIYYVKKTNLGIDEELLFLKQNYDKNADVKQIEEYNGYSIYDFFIND